MPTGTKRKSPSKKKPLELPKAEVLSLTKLVDKLTKINQTDPIAILAAGDQHLGTTQHDNNSVLLLKVLQQVPHRLSGTIGDLFHGHKKLHQLTSTDWEVVAYHEQMDKAGRQLPFLTGNHCHHIYPHPETALARLKPAVRGSRNLDWLTRPRILKEVVYGIADSTPYYGPAAVELGIVSKETLTHKTHPGYFDVMVLLIGKRLFFFRHGDLWDTWYAREGGRQTAKKVFKQQLAHFGSSVYDFLASFDTIGAIDRASRDGVAKLLKKYFSEYRKVCTDIATNSTLEALDMAEPWKEHLAAHKITIGATFSGHSHLATRLTTNDVLHINLGDCRGKKIGIGAITESGEVLGPYEVHQDKKSDAPPVE